MAMENWIEKNSCSLLTITNAFAPKDVDQKVDLHPRVADQKVDHHARDADQKVDHHPRDADLKADLHQKDADLKVDLIPKQEDRKDLKDSKGHRLNEWLRAQCNSIAITMGNSTEMN